MSWNNKEETETTCSMVQQWRSSVPFYFIPLGSKHSAQHHVLLSDKRFWMEWQEVPIFTKFNLL